MFNWFKKEKGIENPIEISIIGIYISYQKHK